MKGPGLVVDSKSFVETASTIKEMRSVRLRLSGCSGHLIALVLMRMPHLL